MSIKRITLLLVAILLGGVVQAKENIGIPIRDIGTAGGPGKIAADCNAPQAFFELNVNNVRARINTGGDMWWDLQNGPKYEVPKIPAGSDQVSIHSLFAGALWIGGIDQLGQLKLAAHTYRQTGTDFYTGPLDDNGQVSPDVCSDFDRAWEVKGTDISLYLGRFKASTNEQLPVSQIPKSVLQWPGRNNPYFDLFELPEDKNLAPFFDRNGDGVYDPTVGDYPVINSDIEEIYGDQMFWWMFNDRGNIHTETGGEAIGLQVGALAFAFATNDEINNMTFYKYGVDNLSTQPLDSVYFGQWVDPDLGQYDDDFVGCVPEEALGIVYNGNAVDGEYGADPPMLGVDFFQGPSKVIGVDSISGEPIKEELGMSAFVYYNNDRSVQGNPENASHYYGYLAGVWKDGVPFTFGGNGKVEGGDPAKFMFPDDPNLPSPAWSECSENNTPADRRFLQSSGPFRLSPGAFNEVIVGVVWVNKGIQYPCPSFDVIKRADKKAQALFDNDFKLKDGPDAPSISVRELDRELILSLWNDPAINSNNVNEAYAEADPVLEAQEFDSIFYRFQGYKLYQLADATVSPSEYNDTDRAREIAVVDIKDGVSQLVNFSFEGDLGIIPEIKVDADDSGIRHTFNIKEDLFALGDKKLVNNKKYYFSAIAYAYNAHSPYDPNNPVDTAQLEPYLEGRNNIKKYIGIPHLPTPQQNGVQLQAEYGDGPEIIRINGSGNNGQFLEFTDATIEEIVNNGYAERATYKGASGPIDVKIYDPMKVPNHKFTLRVPNSEEGATKVSQFSTWTLTDETTGDVYISATNISKPNEESIGGWDVSSLGFTVNVNQTNYSSGVEENAVGSELIFADVQDQWLNLIQDAATDVSINNWIASGSSLSGNGYSDNGDPFYDPNEYYEGFLDGRMAPYALVNSSETRFLSTAGNLSPGCSDCTFNEDPSNNLDILGSVNIVFTPDKTKWTRCVVLEMAGANISQGGALKNEMRLSPSWDKDTEDFVAPSTVLEKDGTYFVTGTSASSITYQNASGEAVKVNANQMFKASDINGNTSFTTEFGAQVYSAANIGRSWFPGYAIHMERGERLNMAFAENSFFLSDNGGDMIWNPSSTFVTANAREFRFGGMHYVYVMNSRYDEGARYNAMLSEVALERNVNGLSAETNYMDLKNAFYLEAMWVTVPMLSTGYDLLPVSDGLIPSEVTLKARVTRPYEQLNEDPVLTYEFDFSNYAALGGNSELAAQALDSVKVVPNPYFAYSLYETSQLDNRVRITNLPTRCDINIFTLDGIFIKQFKIDKTGQDTAAGGEVGTELINSQDWDLKNFKGIPIASGLYLIHIDAPDLGESRTIKWYCIARPIDLDIF